MSLPIGTQLGTHEITALLGKGGMGEVYRARDLSLKREVAIKVLPEALSRDPDRVARLRREAEVLASLNHPRIATIHSLGDSALSPFLVLELVEGDTLADRLERQRLPVDECLRLAGQIAEAMEAAHDKGIIHRDLKPANIKIDPSGNVKVLDFGLAKIRDVWAQRPETDLSNSPTMVTDTAETIVGTTAYMSPEQARGDEVDRATDVWAFGCVLYEMLTRHRTFDGQRTSEVLANVLKTDPDWQRLPPATPDGIRRLLRRCLQKDAKLRFRDIRDARLEIDDALATIPQESQPAAVPARRWERLAWVSIVTLLVLAAAVLGARTLRLKPATEYRLEINTPPSVDSSLAVSPDGLTIVFAAKSGAQSQLWLRSLDSSEARPLPGTERASSPFWSPDSRSIGFFADTALKRLDLDGGSVQTLARNSAVPIGGSWSSDGAIIFSNNPGGPILRVGVNGGEPVDATRLESSQRGHYYPRFLPDGRHFLFFVGGPPAVHGVYVGELDKLDIHRLFDADAAAAYLGTGHVLFIRNGKLLAQKFDPDRLELSGVPFSVAENISASTSLSVSGAGVIAYRTPSPDTGQRQLVWLDRAGREIDKEVYPDNVALGPSLSQDGSRIALQRFVNGNMDIWSYEIHRRIWERLTFDLGDDIVPLWSPDATSIVFAAVREGRGSVLNLYRKSINAQHGDEEPLVVTSDGKFPMDWSRDGKFLLFDTFTAKGGIDIWAVPLDGDRKPFELIRTEFNEGSEQFSPDGKWMAYQSDKTGHPEIYLRPFRSPGGDSLVSNSGGAQVRWNPNGNELFYVAADDRLMAVPIHFSADGKTVEPGTPVALFATNIGSKATLVYRQQYVVSPDGKSFVMNSMVGEAISSPITLILNWKPKAN